MIPRRLRENINQKGLHLAGRIIALAIDLDMSQNSEINKAALHLQAAYMYTFFIPFSRHIQTF